MKKRYSFAELAGLHTRAHGKQRENQDTKLLIIAPICIRALVLNENSESIVFL